MHKAICIMHYALCIMYYALCICFTTICCLYFHNRLSDGRGLGEGEKVETLKVLYISIILYIREG